MTPLMILPPSRLRMAQANKTTAAANRNLKNVFEESAAPSLTASGCLSSRGMNNTAHKTLTTTAIVAAMYTSLWLGKVLAIAVKLRYGFWPVSLFGRCRKELMMKRRPTTTKGKATVAMI